MLWYNSFYFGVSNDHFIKVETHTAFTQSADEIIEDML